MGIFSPLALSDVYKVCFREGGVAKQASLIMAVLRWVKVRMGNWGGDSSHEMLCSILSPEICQKLSVSPQGEPA